MNDGARKRIKPEIKSLLKEVIPSIKLKDIRAIIDKRNYNIIESVELTTELDKTIEGMGIHNVNKRDERGHLTGNYQVNDRSIYRPIQYVWVKLYSDINIEWSSRDIVSESCFHVESCLDRYCEEKIYGSFGKILHSKLGRTLPVQIWNPLYSMSKVYNLAKHRIPEQLNYEDHLFSEADALATYFICRKLGIEILKLIP
jgi:hypothetical protein